MTVTDRDSTRGVTLGEETWRIHSVSVTEGSHRRDNAEKWPRKVTSSVQLREELNNRCRVEKEWVRSWRMVAAWMDWVPSTARQG